MKIKLDENLPQSAKAVLAEAGRDVDSVEEEGLAGADDPTVSAAATTVERLVITLDGGFGDTQRYPRWIACCILVLRVHDQSAASVCGTLSGLAMTIRLTSPCPMSRWSRFFPHFFIRGDPGQVINRWPAEHPAPELADQARSVGVDRSETRSASKELVVRPEGAELVLLHQDDVGTAER